MYVYIYVCVCVCVCVCKIILCTVILIPLHFIYMTVIRLLIQLKTRQIWETKCITNCTFSNHSFILFYIMIRTSTRNLQLFLSVFPHKLPRTFQHIK